MNENKNSIERTPHVSILIIDDDPIWRSNARIIVSELYAELGDDLKIVDVDCIEDGLRALTQQTVHLVLLDKELQEKSGTVVDGIEQIPAILALQPLVHILMYTTEDDARAVVRAMQLGATGYLVKKADPGYEMYVKERISLELRRAKAMLDRERVQRGGRESLTDYVCKSPAMQRLTAQLEALAEVSRPVLFLGATGLGKGAAAKRLSQLRATFLNQSNRPFFNINVAAISNEMAVSELFGHEPNSFTGSGNKTKLGYFELANGGDIFLDEIGDASLELQSKLLKVIEEREFQRVGGSATIRTTARMIFATHRNLSEMVTRGAFREDLFMRIAAFTIEIPKLEDRKDDVPDLIRMFLDRLNKDASYERVRFEDLPADFLEHLKRDNIQGNIRGLENDLQRVLILSPRDTKGRINFTGWRFVLGLSRKYTPQTHSPSGTLSLEQFVNSPTDFLKPGFSNVTTVKRLLEQKLLEEAKTKYPTLSERARVLGMPLPNASRKYSQLRREQEIIESAKGGNRGN